MGRREALKGRAIPDLTQPTIFVTQDTFFALGTGCPSPDIAVKYPVSRHPLPHPPSRTPEEYEATGYRLVEDILPGDLVDQFCAVHLEGDENWEDIFLQGHNQGGGRRQTATGTVNKWFPSEIEWLLLRILAFRRPLKRPRGWRGKSPTWVTCGSLGLGLEPLPLACAHSQRTDWGRKTRMPSGTRCRGTIAGGSPLPWRTTWCGSPSPRLCLLWVLSQQPRPHPRTPPP